MKKKLFICSIFLILLFSLFSTSVFATGNQFVVGLTVANDVTPPTNPSGLSATTVSSAQIDLSWIASTDNIAVLGYVVYRDGTPVATTTTGTAFSDTGLTASTLYSYTVIAYDTSFNYSGASGGASATTDAPSGGGGGGDTTPPSVASFMPANNAGGVNINTTLQMTMSELVNKVSGNMTVRNVSDDSVVEVVPVSGASVSISSSVVTIVLTNPLSSNTAYYVVADAGTFADAAGNNFPGFSGNTTWTFTTIDNVAPLISSVVSSSTYNNATITFLTNEDALSTLEWGTSTTYGLGVASEVVYSTTHAMGVSGLATSTLYYFRLTAKDASNNLSIPSTGNFSTPNPPPPPDTTPPANPGSFTGTPTTTSIHLTWTNPVDVDFSGVRIMRKMTAYPVDQFDGILVYDGAGTSFTNSGLATGTRYYYTAFAYDGNTNYSSGALYTGMTDTGIIIPPPPSPPPPPPPPGGGDTGTTTIPGGTGTTLPPTPTTTPVITTPATSSPPIIISPPITSTSTGPFVDFSGTGTPNIQVAELTIRDVIFTELGESPSRLAVRNNVVRLLVGKDVLVSIPVEKLPKALLTIAISIEDPTHQITDASYFLKENVAKTMYEGVVPRFLAEGKRPFFINILEQEHNSKTSLKGFFEAYAVAKLTDMLPPVVAETINNVVDVVDAPVKNVTSVAAPVGVAVGASQAVLLSTNVGSVYDLYLLLLKLVGLLTGVFRKKRNEPWGVVYDSVTKRPLDPAYVLAKIRDTTQSKGEAITDLDGRYGFFLNPGEYIIEANKTHYKFPSEKLKGKARDEFYENLYFGDPFHVREGGVVQYNIPLDPVEFDWNEFAKNQDQVFKVYSKRKNLKLWFFNILFFVGMVFSIFSLILSFSIINIIVVLVYVSILVFQILWRASHKMTYVKNKTTGTGLPFALIKVWLPGLNTVMKKTVADETGRFYFLVPPGKYFITVEEKQLDGTYKEVVRTEPKELAGGVLKEDILIS